MHLLDPGMIGCVVVAVAFGCLGCAAPATAPGRLRLPPLGGEVVSIAGAIEIRITERSVVVGGTPVASLPSLEESQVVTTGSGAKQSLNKLYIPRLGDFAQRTLSGRRSAVLYVDVDTRFHVLIAVLFTLGQCGVDHFILATSSPETAPSGTARGWVTDAPRKGSTGMISLFLVSSGFALKVLNRNVGSGCVMNEPGPAVPKIDGRHDYAGLAQCIVSVRTSSDGAATTSEADPGLANVSATPGTPYLEVATTIEALRGAGVGAFHFRVPK